MTLEQLKYLCAIVETGSFRSAAESVFRSQSSLSISIKKLEKELCIALFTREDYRPKLTDAGQVIYQKALRLKQYEQEMLTLAEHLAKGFEAELRVSISGIVPIEPIIQVFNSIKQQYPATRLSLLTENLAGTLERLYDDDADIAISEVFDSEIGYESEVITDVTFVSVVPGKSKWAQHVETLSEHDMESETVIVVRDTSTHSQRMSKGLMESTPQWVVNDFAAKQRILCSGTGWGKMPAHLIADDLKQGKLIALNHQAFQPMRVPIKIVRHKEPAAGVIAQQLWCELQHIDWEG